jgi:hypothetical protein
MYSAVSSMITRKSEQMSDASYRLINRVDTAPRDPLLGGTGEEAPGTHRQRERAHRTTLRLVNREAVRSDSMPKLSKKQANLESTLANAGVNDGTQSVDR